MDVDKQIEMKCLSMTLKSFQVTVLGCNQTYLVLGNSDSNCLIIYKIKLNETADFVELIREPIDKRLQRLYDVINKAHFNGNKIWISLYNKEINKMEVRLFEEGHGNVIKLFNLDVASLKLFQKADIETYSYVMNSYVNTIKVLSKLSVCAEANDEYLIFYEPSCIYLRELGSKWLYLMDMKNNKIVDQLEMPSEINAVECVPNRNDFIVKADSIFYYVEYNRNENRMVKYELKDCKAHYFQILIKQQTLILCDEDRDLKYLEVYELNSIVSNKTLPNPQRINRMVWNVTVDNDYLIMGKNDLLLVYKQNDLSRPVKLLHLNKAIRDILVIGKYLCVKLHEIDHYVTFKYL